MDYPTKPVPVPEKSQLQILEERRNERKESLSNMREKMASDMAQRYFEKWYQLSNEKLELISKLVEWRDLCIQKGMLNEANCYETVLHEVIREKEQSNDHTRKD